MQPLSSRRLLIHYNVKQYGGVRLVCTPLFLRRHNVDGHVHHAHGGAAPAPRAPSSCVSAARAALTGDADGHGVSSLVAESWPCLCQHADRVLLSASSCGGTRCTSTRVRVRGTPHLFTLTSWNLLCQSSRSRRFLSCRSSRNRRGSASPVCSRHPNFRELGNHSRSPCDLCGDCGHGRGGVTSPCRTCSSDS